jgi:hypothetical protein
MPNPLFKPFIILGIEGAYFIPELLVDRAFVSLAFV